MSANTLMQATTGYDSRLLNVFANTLMQVMTAGYQMCLPTL